MLYRFRQLARALFGRIHAEDWALVCRLLTPSELQLFTRMPRFDQRHCLDVCETLMRAGHTEPALLRAALLHDTGKVDDNGHAIPLLYYGMFVVLLKLAPPVYWQAAKYGRGLLRPFATHASHEQRSARRAIEAQSGADVIAILSDYAARIETPATQALAWADNQN